MKTITKTSGFIMVALLCLYGCQDNGGNPDEVVPGAVQFSLNDPDEGNRGNAAGAEAYEDARNLIITIEDDQGNVIYDQEQIELFNFSGTLAGEPLSLNPGNYQLTEFLVLNDQGEVIYATPMEGSEYAHLVNDPLPIDFIITTDQTTQVVPEVIDTEEFTPDAFGYATFQFSIVEHFSFLITAFAYDETAQKLVPTTATLTIYEQGTQSVIYNGQLGDSTNAIAVQDGFDYRLVIEKSGYSAVDNGHTNAELKAFAGDPLEVVLQIPGTLPSDSFVDSGQTFSSEGTDAASGDLDGDGDIDLFISRSSGQPSEVWLNDGSGNFANSGQTIGSNNSHHLALGDLDSDGDLDVFIVNYGNQANTVWLNDGVANFSNSGQTLGNLSSLFVSLGDIDGDGDLDAIVGNEASLSNTIWFNDGSGNFTISAQNFGTTAAYGLDLGDVDNDGDLDLFVASINESNRLWLNDGTGTFTDSGQSLGNERSIRVKLADLDGDSDLDAFVANNVFNSSPQPSRVLLNDGNGNFTDSGQSLGNHNVNGLIVVDFDLDGDLDALTVSYYNEPYVLWVNDGNGNFSDSGLSFGNHFGTGVTYSDYDGDGDTDFFVTHSGESHLLWLGEQN
ncbi:MAG: hypothetical protein Roseis2KO_03520 [Roseivirga sp.]